jgi:hypothetical protein
MASRKMRGGQRGSKQQRRGHGRAGRRDEFRMHQIDLLKAAVAATACFLSALLKQIDEILSATSI